MYGYKGERRWYVLILLHKEENVFQIENSGFIDIYSGHRNQHCMTIDSFTSEKQSSVIILLTWPEDCSDSHTALFIAMFILLISMYVCVSDFFLIHIIVATIITELKGRKKN